MTASCIHLQVHAALPAGAGCIAPQDPIQPTWPCLPDPAALAQHHLHPPQSMHSFIADPLSPATAAGTHQLHSLAARNEPQSAPPNEDDRQLLKEVQPIAMAQVSVCVPGRDGPLSLADGRGPVTPPPAWTGGPASQLQPGGSWQEYAASLQPPGTTARLAQEPLYLGTAPGASVGGVQPPPGSRGLVHQLSLAAWAPPQRLMGPELQPLHVPCSSSLDPFCFGSQRAELHNAAQSPSEWRTGDSVLLPADHDGGAVLPAAALHIPAVSSAQQTEFPRLPHSGQSRHPAQQRRAGASSFFVPMGASLLGNEDSLCAFLGGCQRAGAAQQPSSGHMISGNACAPALSGDGCGPSAAQHGEQADAAVPSHSRQTDAEPARPQLATETARACTSDQPLAAGTLPAPAEGPCQGGEVDWRAGQCGQPFSAAAEQLLRAEGEDFWRCLIGVVTSYRGAAAGTD